MRMRIIHSGLVAAGIASVMLSGCGGSDSLTASGTSLTDIAVERGPLLHASVADASGNYGSHVGNGVCRFSGPVAYPVRSVGGYIDTNRNGVVDEGDVKAGNMTMTSGDSMEVGCMVEVTDVNDLTHDLPLVSNLLDATTVFQNLRAGSYNYYWAFDRGLKAMGIADSCCSLGAEYCHPEYLTSSSGQ